MEHWKTMACFTHIGGSNYQFSGEFWVNQFSKENYLYFREQIEEKFEPHHGFTLTQDELRSLQATFTRSSVEWLMERKPATPDQHKAFWPCTGHFEGVRIDRDVFAWLLKERNLMK